jgi:hypothetical protein
MEADPSLTKARAQVAAEAHIKMLPLADGTEGCISFTQLLFRIAIIPADDERHNAA